MKNAEFALAQREKNFHSGNVAEKRKHFGNVVYAFYVLGVVFEFISYRFVFFASAGMHFFHLYYLSLI